MPGFAVAVLVAETRKYGLHENPPVGLVVMVGQQPPQPGRHGFVALRQRIARDIPADLKVRQDAQSRAPVDSDFTGNFGGRAGSRGECFQGRTPRRCVEVLGSARPLALTITRLRFAFGLVPAARQKIATGLTGLAVPPGTRSGAITSANRPLGLVTSRSVRPFQWCPPGGSDPRRRGASSRSRVGSATARRWPKWPVGRSRSSVGARSADYAGLPRRRGPCPAGR